MAWHIWKRMVTTRQSRLSQRDRRLTPAKRNPPRPLLLEALEDRTLLSSFFDSFEAPTLDPFWSTFTQSGSISLTSAIDHTGQQSAQFSSTNTGLNKYVYLFHDFNSPIYGQTSVWIYDTGAGQPSSNYIAFQVSKKCTGFAAGLTTFDYGFPGNGPGNGEQYNYYDEPILNSAVATGIERTQAWHQYSIVDTPQALTLLVDGVTVYTRAFGSPFDEVLLYTQAPYWRPPWVAYFDDFQLTSPTDFTSPPVPTPGVFVVNSTADPGDPVANPGQVTLREAIQDANAQGGGTIDFNIGCGPQVISLTSPLPAITVPVTIDGTSQPGFAGRPIIELNGSAAGGNGLVLNGDLSTIEGLQITGFSGDGIVLDFGQSNVIQGNYITGNLGNGLSILHSSLNLIGTNGDGINDSGERNVISGNGGSGILISDLSDFNVVAGNYIGTDTTGTARFGNAGDGIWIRAGSAANRIGTSGFEPDNSGERNVISGNVQGGIVIQDLGTVENVVAGNFIGTDATGTAALANHGHEAVLIFNGSQLNRIGTNADGFGDAAERNIISGNDHFGIHIWGLQTDYNIVAGNYIGTDVTGTRPLGNTWEGINLSGGTRFNRIGTDGSGVNEDVKRNIISGNLGGLKIENPGTEFNTVAGNYIGTDVTGLSGLGNRAWGIRIIDGAAFNRIGTSGNEVDNVAERNVISGNGSDGILITDPGTDNNAVAGNYIGTDATGTKRLRGAAAPGIISWWKAEGNALDSVGAFNGTLENGATFAPGEVGQAFSFDGVSADVSISNAASLSALTSSITVDAWIKPAVPPTGAAWIYGQRDPLVSEGFTIALDSGGHFLIALRTTISGYSVFYSAPNTVAFGQFQNIAVAYDSGSGQLSLYDNGLPVPLTNVYGPSILSGGLFPVSHLFIGQRQYNNTPEGIGGGAHYAGLIDEIQVYNRALSPSEIATIATLAGNGGDGIRITTGAINNTIGGNTAAARNVISGNSGDGIEVFGGGTTGTVIQANYIGTDVTGSVAIGNSGTGVVIAGGAQQNLIGTNGDGVNDAAEGNLISGNRGAGVVITDTGTNSNVVAGNLIGPDVSGETALGNAAQGIVIANSAQFNRIGTSGFEVDNAGERNVISSNYADPILIAQSSSNVVAGNYLGTDATGTKVLGPGIYGAFTYQHGVDIVGAAAQFNRVGTNGDGVGDGAERNVISGSNFGGVQIWSGASYNIVAGNFIGTDVTGTVALGNGTFVGIFIWIGADHNRVGTDSNSVANAAERNLISGNANFGVAIVNSSNANLVAGNYIGTDVTGSASLPNTAGGVGIFAGSQSNTIGGTTAAAGNLISGNAGVGIDITDSGTTGNLVEGNYIGTDVTGMLPLGNASDGISIQNGASANTIGGTAAGAGNLISANTGSGVDLTSNAGGNLVQGNFIGTDGTGTKALGNAGDGVSMNTSATNTISGNLISGNALDGVHISGNGAAPVQAYFTSDTTGNQAFGGNLGLDFNANHPITVTALGAFDSGGLGFNPGITIGLFQRLPGGDPNNDHTGTLLASVTIVGNEGTLSGNYRFVQLASPLTLQAGFYDIEAIGFNGTNLNLNENFNDGSLIQTNDGGGLVTFVGSGRFDNSTTLDYPASTTDQLGFNTSSHVFGGASFLFTGGAIIQGNSIGTNAAGTAALPNGGNGVTIANSFGNVVGGTTTATRNIVSGNTNDGVLITGQFAVSNVVEGNYIGTDVTGMAPLGNAGSGVAIFAGAHSNQIGGFPQLANTIAFNKFAGVTVTNATTIGNSIRFNSIFANQALGIDLGGDGVTPNHPPGTPGANNFQNYPVLVEARQVAAGTRIIGTLNSLPNTTFAVDLYANITAEPSGFGQGQQYLGTVQVTTDGSGNATFDVTLLVTFSLGEAISATATDPGGDTSEFAQDVPVSIFSASGSNVSATEGVVFTSGVASITDTDPRHTAPSFTATINWGDGTTSAGTVIAARPGTFTVTGSHTYAEEGSDAVSVAITDAGGITLTTTSSAAVADAPLTGSGTLVSASEGLTFSGQVASFADAKPAGTITDFSASIDWGDGSAVTPGVVTEPGGAGTPFVVGGSHTYAEEGSHTITMTVTDVGGSSTTAMSTATVAIVPPTAGLSGPTDGVPGQPRTFTFSATHPSPVDQAAGFIYAINWGDGTPVQAVPRTAGNGAGVKVDHIYTVPGSYLVQVSATEDGGSTGTASSSVTIQSVEMQGNSLAVGGTLGNDTIVLSPADTVGDINVNYNGVSLGNFLPTDHILVYGQSGNDTIQLASSTFGTTVFYVTVPAFLYGGGTGRDILDASGSSANNVLVGGAGTNVLFGGLGRDLLIGGLGASKLHAGSGDDLLIGGWTDYDLTSTAMTYDQKLLALEAIMAEWGRTDADYLTRVHHLDGSLSGGLNGSYLLNATTVHDNRQADTLFGAPGFALDWFFADPSDTLKHLIGGEVNTTIS